MFRPIQCPDAPITLVGGGEGSVDLLRIALAHAPVLVAVDGGAQLAHDAGVTPRAIVGDFDSLDDALFPDVTRLHRPDQNFTDFQKCLEAIDAPLFLGVGFLGGRLDHQLAAFNTVLKEERPVILLSETELAFIAPRAFDVALRPGSPFSAFPLLPTGLTSTGLLYPLTQAAVSPDGVTSTSNTVDDGGHVTLVSDHRVILVTLPLAALPGVISALSG